MSQGGALRFFRAFLVTALVLALASGAHVIGGEHLPAPAIFILLAILLLVPVTALAGRELSLKTLLMILGGGQVLLHGAFSAFAGGAICQSATTARPAHHGPAAGIECLSPEASAALLASHGTSILMLTGHALAVLAMAWVLRKGEEALWQLLAWLRTLIRALQLAPIVPDCRIPAVADVLVPPAPWRNLRLDAVRGPPARLVFP